MRLNPFLDDPHLPAVLVWGMLSFPLALQSRDGASEEPPSRALSRELTSCSRLAGTSGSLVGARIVERVLAEAGFEVELDTRKVLLSYPRRVEFAAYESSEADRPIAAHTFAFDPDVIPPPDVPPFNAWARSGSVRGPLIDAGTGSREDFERLRSLGADTSGCVALVRYGGSYRGAKVELAAEYGCAGVLLFSDPQEDGGSKGAVWPEGPWKPDWAVQRGSIGRVSRTPGDPSTPGWASPPPGERAPRVSGRDLLASLPPLPTLPIDARTALLLRGMLAPRQVDEGSTAPVGPGPVEVFLDLAQEPELRTIHNVIARLSGESPLLVIAGNHRDAWVRGAQDAASGTVALLRAAQILSERMNSGWRPTHSILLAFWDAEEFGLIGSTEWGEDHREELRNHALCYINADSVVGGTQFGAAGTPGLLGVLRGVLESIPSESAGRGTLWNEWVERSGEGGPRLDLPGSGSDFAVFLHHLSLPVLDVGFSGSGGGQYHTCFDDFAVMDRFIDPGWVGHELAGRFFASLLERMSGSENGFFDAPEAARALAGHARAAGAEAANWLGRERAERLAQTFEKLAEVHAARPARLSQRSFYQRIEVPEGLPDRPWFRNRIWAPGLETGYSSETFPTLRRAALRGEEALDSELFTLIHSLEAAARLAASD